MHATTIPTVQDLRRHRSPAVTPQALAWHSNIIWMGSRDLTRIYGIDVDKWEVIHETDAPGIPWAAVSVGETLRVTLGLGEEDDRYIQSFDPAKGFAAESIACPDLTGSYLSFDGEHVYLSQWYKQRLLKLDSNGTILRTINIGAEISGHTFVDGLIYVLRGAEKPTEEWSIARLDPREETPNVIDLARVPFACRSLAFDGTSFWSNHRAANEMIRFNLPE
jgi:hypothetical protein